MTGEWQLRPAVVSEAPALAALQVRSRRAAGMPPVPDEAALAADLAAGTGPDQVWVAEQTDDGGAPGESGTLLGYVRFVLPDAERVGWLDDLYVDPAHAGQGVGGALLDLVRAWLPTGFGLWAFEANTAARGFYRTHGLREVERVPADASPTGEAEVRLASGP